MKWFMCNFLFSLFSLLITCLELPAQVPKKIIKKPVSSDTVKKTLIQLKKLSIFYVDQSSGAGGNGTALHPFRKITEALNASDLKNQSVVVNVITGTYRENLEISRNTTLQGITKSGQPEKAMGAVLIGSVTNYGAFSLQIKNLRIANSGAPGAIVVNNHGAKTILNNVSIDRATRYGIYQKGGTLDIKTASVVYCTPGMISDYERQNNIDEEVSYGTGIFLSDVAARLFNVNLRSNVQGLVADGAGTHVEIHDMTAERHTVNPFLKDDIICNTTALHNGVACMEASNGAYLELYGVRLLDNDFCGLSIRDGARVKGSDVIILRTRKVLCPGNKVRGGINASVRRGGAYLELTQFELGYADMISLQLVNAKAKCSNGNVHHNPIGMHIKDPLPGFNWDDLLDRVIFQDNERNFEADTLPIPH